MAKYGFPIMQFRTPPHLIRKKNDMTTPRLTASQGAALMFLLLLLACNRSESPQYTDGDAAAAKEFTAREAAPPPSAPPLATNAKDFPTTAAVIGRWDTLKQLVRTAELSFRTPDALQASLAIEDIVRQQGGFVLENDLSQHTEQHYITPISCDSSLETRALQTRNRLVVRVPHTRLDTTLRAIVRLADLLDYRRVKAEDVSLKWLEEELTRLRQSQFQGEVQADVSGNSSKLKETVEARQQALNARAAADAARLEQLRLQDAVQLSTITIDLYQRPVVRRERIANLEDIASWEPDFGAQLGDALRGGWRGLKIALVFLARLWPLWLLLAGLWQIRRYWPRKSGKKQPDA